MAKDGLIAERFVADHCSATFLSLWGMANPVGKDLQKELCDYLVVCTPDIVIFSVKDIRLPPEPDKVAADRWRRKAIEESARAIYGAERQLQNFTSVQTRNGRELKLPSLQVRRIHRICVAFGSRREIPISAGDHGKGFVHVLDDLSFPLLLRELDTIGDFLNYLDAKRSLIEGGCAVAAPGEEELLALYLHNGRSFPSGHDRILLDETLWDGLSKDSGYQAALEANRISYAWDNIIEYVTKDLIAGDLLFSNPAGSEEAVLRVMAREPRFYRRYLSESVTQVLGSSDIRARIIRSDSGVVYVVVAFPRGEDRDFRKAELAARCFVARSMFKNEPCKVVGIASERANDGKPGLSFDLMMVDIPDWTPELEDRAEKARTELGFFKSPKMTNVHHDEYPNLKNNS